MTLILSDSGCSKGSCAYVKRRERERCGHEFLAGARGQQHHLWWSAVSAIGGLFTNLWADAYSEPDARLAFHARRLCWRNARRRHARFPIQFLAGGGPGDADGGRARRLDRTLALAPSARRSVGTGARHPRPIFHGRRFLFDDVGRRPALGSDTIRARRLRPFWRRSISDLPAGHHRPCNSFRHRTLAPSRPHAAPRPPPPRGPMPPPPRGGVGSR